MALENPNVRMSLIVPGLPQPLLEPDGAPSWMAVREGFEAARERVEASGADLLLLYSTQWPSVLGHQIQAAERLEWIHVDPEFHEFGSIPYDLAFDARFGEAYAGCARARGLHARTVAYHGFPVDTGTIVALKLLNPKGRLPVCVVSSNIYADRAETVVLGKAALDALKETGRTAVAVAVSALSGRMIPRVIDSGEEGFALPRDDEWNRKILEILAAGRLEDVAQLARNFHREARADQKFKGVWWLSAVAGAHNRYRGEVLAYGSLQGMGAAVVALTEREGLAGEQEFDEDNVEFFRGERNVLSGAVVPGGPTAKSASGIAAPQGNTPRGPAIPPTKLATPESTPGHDLHDGTPPEAPLPRRTLPGL